MRVLLVEDDELIGKGIVAGLSKHGIGAHTYAPRRRRRPRTWKKPFMRWCSIWAFPTATGWN